MGRRNLRNVQVNYETSIKKSNELSLAQLNQGLSLNQMQLMSFAILNTQQNGKTSFNKPDFEKQFGLGEYRTEYAKLDSKAVTQTQFYLFDDHNNKFAFQNLFLGMSYDNGLFEFEWNPKLVQHILNLKERYITTDLSITSKFKSGYSWMLYELLKAKYGFWYFDFETEELKKFFGVSENKSYVNAGNFKQRVLDKAIEEVNKYTEFQVEYKEYKQQRKIVRFKLIWSTGKTIRKASDRQIDQLKTIAEVATEDWVKVHTQKLCMEDALRTKKLVVRLREIASLTTDALTFTHASQLIEEATRLMDQLEQLGEELSQRKNLPDVPLVNWLE